MSATTRPVTAGPLSEHCRGLYLYTRRVKKTRVPARSSQQQRSRHQRCSSAIDATPNPRRCCRVSSTSYCLFGVSILCISSCVDVMRASGNDCSVVVPGVGYVDLTFFFFPTQQRSQTLTLGAFLLYRMRLQYIYIYSYNLVFFYILNLMLLFFFFFSFSLTSHECVCASS